MPRPAKPKAKAKIPKKLKAPKEPKVTKVSKVRKPRTKKATREKLSLHPYEERVGALVRFYDDGWRHGHLEEIIYGLTEAKDVLIRPIAGYKAVRPRCIQIPLTDMNFVDNHT